MNHRQIPGDTIPWQKRSNLIALIENHHHVTVEEALTWAHVSLRDCVNSEWLAMNLTRYSNQLKLDGNMLALSRWTELYSLMLSYAQTMGTSNDGPDIYIRVLPCEGRVRRA